MTLRVPVFPAPLCWLPTGIVAGLILIWSIVTTPPTSVPAVATVLTGVGATEAATSGIGGTVPDSYVRHAIAYATLALTLAYAIADREGPVVRKALFVFTLAAGYGVVMEIGQLFQPDRVASLADVGANVAGAAVALAWYELEQRVQFVPVETTGG